MRTDKRLWRNRKARKELARRLQAENPRLEVVHAQAAGIDVGNSAHYVGATGPRPGTGASVRVLHRRSASANRLVRDPRSEDRGCGVYWIPLYVILEERGFEVYLVNARHTKNLLGGRAMCRS
jgi:hypothetical protein